MLARGNSWQPPSACTWLSAAEIAEANLPGLPADKRKLNDLIALERWATRAGPDGQPLHRKRAARGGGFEWHSSLLPERARHELVRRGIIAAPIATIANVVELPRAAVRDAAWAAFDRLPQARKAEAAERLAILQAVEALQASGTTKTRAIAITASQDAVSPATINNWFALVAGIGRHDRLSYLAPATRGGGAAADIDPEMWDLYRSDWLRFSKPTHAACYWRVQRVATARGLAIPCAKTFQRKAERDIPPEVILALRDGAERVAAMIPTQQRSVGHLHAMHSVNIDGHTVDVFVAFPDGTVMRPTLVGIQDLFSRKTLAWRVDKSENAIVTRLVFADLFRTHGIPHNCYLDNGRAFASLWITNGARTRFRFKTREDLPEGLLPALGIKPVFVQPYSGRSKPIERAWKELCEYISKGPWFAGAYAGNSPTNKPEDYGKRAIPLAEFEAVLTREIFALNAKMGRRTETAKGRSFDQVFEASIKAGAPVGRATAEQMRLALLTADHLTADRKTGAVTLAGNRYWCEAMGDHAGQRLTIRFDPDNLHSSVFAYDMKGRFLAELPVIEAVGFDDLAGAKATAKLRADKRKIVRALIEAEQLISADQVARALAALDADIPEPVSPPVTRLVRGGRRGNAAVAVQVEPVSTDFDQRFRAASAGLRLVE